MCLDIMPNVLHRVEAIQIIKVKIKYAIEASKDEQQPVIDDCE
jgi:hypothetical protein